MNSEYRLLKLKAYEPKLVEQDIYEFWMKAGYFQPKIDINKKPFTIILLPDTQKYKHEFRGSRSHIFESQTKWIVDHVIDKNIVLVLHLGDIVDYSNAEQWHYASKSLNILNGIDLVIPSGQFIAITGASGSGKTTLLSLIAGLDEPTDGNIIINGQDIMKFSEDELAELRSQHFGFIFQNFNLSRF